MTPLSISPTTPVGEVATKYPATVHILQQHRIDFCCGGGQTVEFVAKKRGLPIETLLAELAGAADKPVDDSQPNEDWSPSRVIDYILEQHHRYVEREIPVLLGFLEKLERVHGERHPELKEINALFKVSASELMGHLRKEELVAFPAIRNLEQWRLTGQPDMTGKGPQLNDVLAILTGDHSAEGARFETISDLSAQYSPPADACNTYRVTYDLLRNFEADLHRHIHLENNLLFPKAVAMAAMAENQS